MMRRFCSAVRVLAERVDAVSRSSYSMMHAHNLTGMTPIFPADIPVPPTSHARRRDEGGCVGMVVHSKRRDEKKINGCRRLYSVPGTAAALDGRLAPPWSAPRYETARPQSTRCREAGCQDAHGCCSHLVEREGGCGIEPAVADEVVLWWNQQREWPGGAQQAERNGCTGGSRRMVKGGVEWSCDERAWGWRDDTKKKRMCVAHTPPLDITGRKGCCSCTCSIISLLAYEPGCVAFSQNSSSNTYRTGPRARPSVLVSPSSVCVRAMAARKAAMVRESTRDRLHNPRCHSLRASHSCRQPRTVFGTRHAGVLAELTF